jgi:hypothetical protein
MVSRSDDFERASLGSNWTPLESGMGLSLFSSSDLGTSNANGQEIYWNADTFSEHQYSEAVVSAGGGELSVAVRMATNGANTRYAWSQEVGSGYNNIEKTVNGSWSTVGSAPSGRVAVGDTARIEVDGNSPATIRAVLNGTTVLTVTDSSITSGQPGLGFYANTGGRFESWAGGDLPLVYVQEAHAKGATGSVGSVSVQLPANWTPGNKILVVTQTWSGTGTLADSQGFTWTPLATVLTASDNGQLKVWETNVGGSAPAANPTITVTLSANGYGTICALEIKGLDTTASPVGASGTGAASSSSPSATTSGNVPTGGVLAFAIYGDSGWGQAVSPASGYTARSYQPYVGGSGMPVHVATKDVAPSSGATYTATTVVSGSTGWGEIALVYKLDTGPPPADEDFDGAAFDSVAFESTTSAIQATITAAGAASASFVTAPRHRAIISAAGAGATSVTVRQRQRATITAAGVGSSSVTARQRQRNTGALTGAGTTSFQARQRQRNTGTFAGAASTSFVARVRWQATTAATGGSSTSFAGRQRLPATITATGPSSTSLTASYTGPGISFYGAGVGSTNVSAYPRWRLPLAATGAGTSSYVARIRWRTTETATGVGSVTVAVRLKRNATLSASGSGASAVTVRMRLPASFASTGGSTANVVARTRYAVTITATGTGSTNLTRRLRLRNTIAVAGAGSSAVTVTYRPPPGQGGGNLQGAGATSFAATVRTRATITAIGVSAVFTQTRVKRVGTISAAGAGTAQLSSRLRLRSTGAFPAGATTLLAARARYRQSGAFTGSSLTSLNGRVYSRLAGGLTGASSTSFTATLRGEIVGQPGDVGVGAGPDRGLVGAGVAGMAVGSGGAVRLRSGVTMGGVGVGSGKVSGL